MADAAETVPADPLWDDWDRPPRISDSPVLHLAGFDGPMDLLLDLAERQRIDLGRISVLRLAEQFIAEAERLAAHVPLERRADALALAAPSAGDDVWSIGCRAYSLSRNQLRRSARFDEHAGPMSSGAIEPAGDVVLDDVAISASEIDVVAALLTSIDNPANTAFKAALEKKFGADMKTPNDLSEPEYDGIYLYKAAVEKAGSTDAAKVLKALGEVSFDGPRGTVSMDKEHHAALTMYLGQVQADGSVKVIQKFANVSPGNQCPKLKG